MCRMFSSIAGSSMAGVEPKDITLWHFAHFADNGDSYHGTPLLSRLAGWKWVKHTFFCWIPGIDTVATYCLKLTFQELKVDSRSVLFKELCEFPIEKISKDSPLRKVSAEIQQLSIKCLQIKLQEEQKAAAALQTTLTTTLNQLTTTKQELVTANATIAQEPTRIQAAVDKAVTPLNANIQKLEEQLKIASTVLRTSQFHQKKAEEHSSALSAAFVKEAARSWDQLLKSNCTEEIDQKMTSEKLYEKLINANAALGKSNQYPTFVGPDLWKRWEHKEPCPIITAVNEGGCYLNANRVGLGMTQRQIIASGFPSFCEYTDFWTAVCKGNYSIIDLTTQGAHERGESYTKPPHEYVETISRSDSMYTHAVTLNGSKKEVTRYHFAGWPDGGVIPVKDLITLVEKVSSMGPLWIHCERGIGRTGVLTTAIILKEYIDKEMVTLDTLKSFLFKAVFFLRTQRCPKFVHMPEQFALLIEYGKALLKAKSTTT